MRRESPLSSHVKSESLESSTIRESAVVSALLEYVDRNECVLKDKQ